MRYLQGVALLMMMLVAGADVARASRATEPVEPIGCASGPEAVFEVSIAASRHWGVAPFETEFEIVALGYDVLLGVEWDFDGDGLGDAYGEVVEHTFVDPVDYAVTARVSTLSHGTLTRSVTVSGYTSLVSVTFDDGQQSIYSNAFPILEARGLTATVYVVPTWIHGGWYLTWEELHALQDNGWDIGSHTLTHQDLTKVDSTTLHYELSRSKTELEARGFTARHFAVPYGACNWTVIDATRLYYDSCRGWKGLNPPLEDTDPYLLKWDVTARTRPLSDYTAMMDSVATYGGWYILNNHLVYPDCGAISICVTDQMFADILDYALEHRMKILNVDEALSSLEPGEPRLSPPRAEPHPADGLALRVEQPHAVGLPICVAYTVPLGLGAEVGIYDVTGRRVRALCTTRGPGEHAAAWYGDNDWGIKVADGHYFCVLEATDGRLVVSKVSVIR